MSVFKENDILPAICPFQFLFILPLTFNQHFIPFLDGDPAELINIPVTHTQATLMQSKGKKKQKTMQFLQPSFQSAGHFSQLRLWIKAALHAFSRPSPSVSYFSLSRLWKRRYLSIIHGDPCVFLYHGCNLVLCLCVFVDELVTSVRLNYKEEVLIESYWYLMSGVK